MGRTKRRFIAKNVRKRKIYFFLLLSCLFMIGLGYANLVSNLGINGSLGINGYDFTLYGVLEREEKHGGSALEYTGTHQDSIFNTGTDKIYYWHSNSSSDFIREKNNVIFAGHCWQMLRTTDTGGVKLLYNGEVENNQCLSTRGNHVGYGSRISTNLASNYYYGTSYEYDEVNEQFSLSGTKKQVTWSASEGAGLIGTYTCMSSNENATCSTLYLVESYDSSTNAFVISLENSSHYSTIGTIPFNGNSFSVASVGYMYNTIYGNDGLQLQTLGSNVYKYASGFTYHNGQYTLNSDTVNYSWDNANNLSNLNTHHYTCFNATGTCSTLSYIYYVRDGGGPYFIHLTDGKSVEDALYEMLYADDVNKTSSVIKNGIESWYLKYLNSYSEYIEDTIYCNERNIGTLNGWDSNGGSILSGNHLNFIGYDSNNVLSCHNTTDQFSTLNSKALLKYKIGLATLGEMSLFNNAEDRTTGAWYYLMTPNRLFESSVRNRVVSDVGALGGSLVSNLNGVRPVISLVAGTKYVSGNGSMANPYVVETETADHTKFSTDSWETIIQNVQNGNTDEYHIGDTKEIDMGSLGTHTLRIANKTVSSNCYNTNFSQTACGFVLEFADIITTYNMNSTSTNDGGWPASEMRTYVNGDIYNALPAVLKNAIIDTKVMSGYDPVIDSHSFVSIDKLYLLDYLEVFGKERVGDTVLLNETRRLDYYAGIPASFFDYSGTIKKNNGVDSSWWHRSIATSYTGLFGREESSGFPGAGVATDASGVSPAFRLSGPVTSSPSSFSTDSWDTITTAARTGNTSAYQIGDTKTINMGSLGTHTVRIVNKTITSDCSNSQYSETACGFVLEFADIVSTKEMNPVNTNVGGWPVSGVRSYINGEVYRSLPEELRRGIINTRVISGHGSTTGEDNFVSNDKLYLLDNVEIFGTNHVYDSLKDTQTRKLDYYTGSNSDAVKQFNNEDTSWWNRSAVSANSTQFGYLIAQGYGDASDANVERGVSPAFRIG